MSESLKEKMKIIFKTKKMISIKDNPNAFQFRKFSIKRPNQNCSITEDNPYNKFTSHLTPGEWRIAAWLEREGPGYDVVSGYTLHNNPMLLENYKAIILSTHCEYWSKEMFGALKNFYEQGGSILNLSGNSIYRVIVS